MKQFIFLCVSIGILSVVGNFTFVPAAHASGGGEGGEGGEADEGDAGGFVDGVSAAFGSVSDAFGDAFGGISSAVGSVGDAASDAFGAATDFGRDALGIGSDAETGESDSAGADADAGSDADAADASGNASVGVGNSEGAGFIDPASTRPAKESANLLSDLQGHTSQANVQPSQVVFRGYISNTSKSAATAPQGKQIVSNLLLDYDCDGRIELRRDFPETFSVIAPGEKPALGIGLTVPLSSEGKKHCFAVNVDKSNVVREANEGNNRSSDWSQFVVTEVTSVETITTDTTSPTNTAKPTNPSVTTNNSSRPEAADITLEARALVSDDGFYTNASGQVLEPVGNGAFSTSDLTLQSNQELSLRWNAPNYDTCNSSFTATGGQTSGTTEQLINEQISGTTANRVLEPNSGETKTYTLICSKDNQEFSSSLTVAVE